MESTRQVNKVTSVENIACAASELRENTDSKKHTFSEPWEDSDTVLVVEEQKFHLHRLMLSMSSPVFKAMLSSNFKEKDAAEIELPGKKASEMLDLLKMVYPQEQVDITINNVEHIVKLADEYQMRSVLSICEKFLLTELKVEKEYAMKILLLAQQCNMTSVRESCYTELKGMQIKEMQELEGFEGLDGDSLRELLVPRMENLESLLQNTYLQLAGVLDLAMYLYQESGRPMKRCRTHYKKLRCFTTMQQRIEQCLSCKEMIKTMATGTGISVLSEKQYPDYSSRQRTFDENIVKVLNATIIALEIDTWKTFFSH